VYSKSSPLALVDDQISRRMRVFCQNRQMPKVMTVSSAVLKAILKKGPVLPE